MVGTSRLRRFAANFALLLVSTFLVLVVLEIAARIVIEPRAGKEKRERVTYTEYDPLLGWRLRPNARVRYERNEYTTDVAINSLGYRDRERSLTPSAGTQRVLALGDSFVEGYTVQLEQTVGQVMERRLTRPACPLEVINAGSGGYSTEQEVLLYRDRARRLGARVVVLFFFFNDLAPLLEDSYYGAPKPRITFDDSGQLLFKTDHIRPTPPEESEPPAPKTRKPRRLRSAAWAWLQIRLSIGAPRLHDRLARWGLWEPVDRLPVHPEMKAFRRLPSHAIQIQWAVADRLLSALKADVEADGAKLLVVYVPSRMEVNDTDWEATCIRYNLRPKRWARDAVVLRLEASGRQGGFPVLDLTPALRAADRAPFWRVYLDRDRHWNARGHRVAGEAVADYLRQNNFLSTCTATR
jgi:hypothetical protein